MKKIAIVVGYHDSGKGSLIDAARKSRNYKVVSLGEVMLGIAKKKRLASNIEQLKKLSGEQNSEIRTAAINKIAAMDGNIVLETHGGAAQHGRLFPGLSHYVTKHLKHTVGLFYLDSNRKRRQKGNAWERSQKNINLAILSYNADDLNIPLHVINTGEGDTADAKRKFIGHLNDAFST